MTNLWEQFKPRRPNEIPYTEVGKRADAIGYRLNDSGAEQAMREAIANSDLMTQDPVHQALFAAIRMSRN